MTPLELFGQAMEQGAEVYLDELMAQFDTEPFEDFRPLAVAAEKGRLDVVSMMLSHPRLNAGNEAAVVAAVKNKNADMLGLMFASGLTVGREAMLSAVATGDEAIMRLVSERVNGTATPDQSECTMM